MPQDFEIFFEEVSNTVRVDIAKHIQKVINVFRGNLLDFRKWLQIMGSALRAQPFDFFQFPVTLLCAKDRKQTDICQRRHHIPLLMEMVGHQSANVIVMSVVKRKGICGVDSIDLTVICQIDFQLIPLISYGV